MNRETVIAFVDDDWDFSVTRIEGLERLIPIAQFVYYETCQECLDAIAQGKRHGVYLLDQSGGPTLGSVCAEEIMFVDPDTSIIGMSIDDVGDQFPQGTQFVNKKAGPEALANLLKNLLGG